MDHLSTATESCIRLFESQAEFDQYIAWYKAQAHQRKLTSQDCAFHAILRRVSLLPAFSPSLRHGHAVLRQVLQDAQYTAKRAPKLRQTLADGSESFFSKYPKPYLRLWALLAEQDLTALLAGGRVE